MSWSKIILIWTNGSSKIYPNQFKSYCCFQFCDRQTWTLDLKLFHVWAHINQQAIYCWVQLYVIHLCKLEYSVSFPAPNDQYLAMNGIFLVCHHLFLNFSWFLLLFLPWFKIFCRNEDEKKRERGRRCWRHCYQWKRNSVV
jgi:hypothetical protein